MKRSAAQDEVEPAAEAFSRRAFLKGAGGAGAGGLLGQAAQAARSLAPQDPARSSGTLELELSINGESRALSVEPRTTLLDALRCRLDPALTGSKLVCDRGACGACTVHLDGRPVYACMLLALDAVGREVTTVEGLARDGRLSPVQQAFVDKDALMCGFCTPGFVMSVSACLARDPAASLDVVRAACSGNLCRCGTYPHVFEAALEAGRKLQRGR